MLFHFQIKHNGLVFVPSPRNNELGNSISEIEILSLMSITYYVVLPILGAKKKVKTSAMLHTDMKQSIVILF